MSAVLGWLSYYFVNKRAQIFGFHNSCNCITENLSFCCNPRISKQDIKGVSDVTTLKIFIHMFIFIGQSFFSTCLGQEFMCLFSISQENISIYICSICFKLSSCFQLYLSLRIAGNITYKMNASHPTPFLC
jgi:hypothetical protein